MILAGTEYQLSGIKGSNCCDCENLVKNRLVASDTEIYFSIISKIVNIINYPNNKGAMEHTWGIHKSIFLKFKFWK